MISEQIQLLSYGLYSSNTTQVFESNDLLILAKTIGGRRFITAAVHKQGAVTSQLVPSRPFVSGHHLCTDDDCVLKSPSRRPTFIYICSCEADPLITNKLSVTVIYIQYETNRSQQGCPGLFRVQLVPRDVTTTDLHPLRYAGMVIQYKLPQ